MEAAGAQWVPKNVSAVPPCQGDPRWARRERNQAKRGKRPICTICTWPLASDGNHKSIAARAVIYRNLLSAMPLSLTQTISGRIIHFAWVCFFICWTLRIVFCSVSLFSLRGVSLGFQCPGAAAPGARGGEFALCAG